MLIFLCRPRQEKQSEKQEKQSAGIELDEAGEIEREVEGQQETEEEDKRLGARGKSNVHSLEGHVCDLGEKNSGPNQVKLPQYPQHTFGAKKRAFNANWFDSFTWLEYSKKKDAAFCFPCRIFGKHVKHDTFVSTGLQNWKKALELFKDHEKTPAHKASMVSWHGYKASAAHGSVIEQLDSASEQEIKERRQYLSRVVAVSKFLGKQNIPFRGHDESMSSNNQGNFLECMNLLKEFDPFLQSYSAPSHSTYLSPSSQNEVIECCAKEIVKTISQEIKQAGMFAIMADEARDGSTEQLAVCVRYVSEGCVKERLLAMVDLEAFDAASLTNAIEEQLRLNGIEDVKVVAQTYDGASVMSGTVGGVQCKFRENHPMAIYVHCYAHQLNLVLCCTCQAIPEAKNLFDLLQSVYSFFSVSLVNHQKFKETQKLLGLQPTELVQLSKTRWSCQLKSINAMIEHFPAVLQCLSSINNPTAVGLHVKLARFSTVYLLMMFKTLLLVTENLHKFLQSETVDMAKAEEYKCAVCDTLKDMRTEEKAAEIYDAAKAFCEANQVPVTCAVPRQRQKQKRMDDYVVESSCGALSDLGNAEKLRESLYIPCLDRMVAEMEQRFSSLNSKVLKGVMACNPGSKNFLCEEDLRGLAEHYNVDVNHEEVLVAKNYLSRKQEIKDMQCLLGLLDHVMFPTLTQVIQISLTIPVSSCSCERTFSVLRRLHTWLRSTMGQERLHNLAILTVEREELSKLNHCQVIDCFAKMKPRRYRLLLKK